MNIYHNSHDINYRRPFGAAVADSTVTLFIKAKGISTCQLLLWNGDGSMQRLPMNKTENGFDITFTAVDTHEHMGSFTDSETGKTTYQKMLSWYLRFTYAVESDFNHVAYVEPASSGTVTVTVLFWPASLSENSAVTCSRSTVTSSRPVSSALSSA